MALVFIGLGSNQGDGRQNLLQAWEKLGEIKGVTRLAISSPWRTSPVVMGGAPPLAETPFINAVGAINTSIEPADLLRTMLTIEDAMGRDRTRGPDRIIDLDLLFYNDLCLMTPDLVLPHPEISRRLFVLMPLAEIAPDHIHPESGKSSLRMCRELETGDQKAEKSRWPNTTMEAEG